MNGCELPVVINSEAVTRELQLLYLLSYMQKN